MKIRLAIIFSILCGNSYAGGLKVDSPGVIVGRNYTDSGGSTAIETYNGVVNMNFSGTNPNNLWLGLYLHGVYNAPTVGFTPSVSTAHGGPLFVRGEDSLLNNGFSYSIEGNSLCRSTQTSAYCTSMIAHSKWDSSSVVAAGGTSANLPQINGITSRIDITSDNYGTTALSTGTAVDFYPSPGLGGLPGRRFVLLNDYDMDKQIINAGNIIKISTATNSTIAITGGGTLNPTGSHILGGVAFVTSTATITMASSAFTAPANTYGNYAIQGWFVLCNANNPSGNISIPHGGTVFNKGSATVTLTALNSTAACAGWVGTTLGVWLQMF